MTTKKTGKELIDAFESFADKKAFFQFLEILPYPIEIFAPDGTAVYFNRAGCEQAKVSDPSQVVGHYNILLDPVTNDMLGLREEIAQAFSGKIRTVHDVRVPHENTKEHYVTKDELLVEAKYMDISAFPLHDSKGKIVYIVMMFFTKYVYKGKKEIIQAQEYINSHWQDEYDIAKIAEMVNLSKFHFLRLYKQATKETLFNYYKRVKINKLKEKLLDPNLNVVEAFDACKIPYNGHYIALFKKIIGKTPLECQKEALKTK